MNTFWQSNKKFLVLGEGSRDDINYDDVATVKNKVSINFTNLKTKFCLSLR